MESLIQLADKLAGGGAVAVILILLIVISALVTRVVRIPDKEYVPREMYEEKVKSEIEWKNIAIANTNLTKEQADQISSLTDILEAQVGRRK